MRSATESDLTAQVIAAVKAHGWPAWRNAQYRRGKKHGGLGTGTSDVIACVRGRFVALEVKKPKDGVPVTPEQTAFLALVNRSGGVGVVVRSVAETAEVVQRLAKGVAA